MRKNYTGEPALDRGGSPSGRVECLRCAGPCKLPDWARDSSYFANNPSAYDAHLARCHMWLEESWLKGVRIAIAALRAMVLVPTFGCVSCGQFAFERVGVLCFWCRR